MKRPNRIIYLLTLLVMGRIMFDLTGCTHDDQVIEELQPSTVANFSNTELLSAFTTKPPTIDGTIESAWDAAIPLKTRVTVPAIAGDKVPANFFGYAGKGQNVTMRSMYDNENIYFLLEWDDNTKSMDRETWYFDPTDSRWKQESRYPIFNSDDVMTRDGFYEDKFAILWNVGQTVSNWNAQTCYATCHTGLGAASGYSRHYTNSPNERVDMWHWKSVRDVGTMDDQYQDNTQPNGRKSDAKTGGGYSDNKQTMTITGTATSVSVPKYVIPGRKNYYRVLQEEISNGTAKLITAVDNQGVLTYNGGSIDPNVEKGFQRAGAGSGAYGIPSIVASRIQGNAGDIAAEWVFTGSGYIMELKRKLNTGDTDKVDVNFSDLSDQPFGIGVFENAALAHAIKPNLVLKFGKK